MVSAPGGGVSRRRRAGHFCGAGAQRGVSDVATEQIPEQCRPNLTVEPAEVDPSSGATTLMSILDWEAPADDTGESRTATASTYSEDTQKFGRSLEKREPEPLLTRL